MGQAIRHLLRQRLYALLSKLCSLSVTFCSITHLTPIPAESVSYANLVYNLINRFKLRLNNLRYLILKSTQIVLVASIISVIIVSFPTIADAVKSIDSNSEAKQMAEDQRRNPETNEIRLPEHLRRQLEENERAVQRGVDQASARRTAQMTATERTEAEQERRRWRESESAPERRTEEKIRQDEERAIRLLDESRTRRQQAENTQ
jgi:hypothetical protein